MTEDIDQIQYNLNKIRQQKEESEKEITRLQSELAAAQKMRDDYKGALDERIAHSDRMRTVLESERRALAEMEGRLDLLRKEKDVLRGASDDAQSKLRNVNETFAEAISNKSDAQVRPGAVLIRKQVADAMVKSGAFTPSDVYHDVARTMGAQIEQLRKICDLQKATMEEYEKKLAEINAICDRDPATYPQIEEAVAEEIIRAEDPLRDPPTVKVGEWVAGCGTGYYYEVIGNYVHNPYTDPPHHNPEDYVELRARFNGNITREHPEQYRRLYRNLTPGEKLPTLADVEKSGQTP